MFRRPFKVKSSTQLKGSDRKKLRLEILRNYPKFTVDELNILIPNKEIVTAVKLLTHSCESVIVYCVQNDPIVCEAERGMFPTVYMLWRFPDLLFAFTTRAQVIPFIAGGADLMLPGVVLYEPITSHSFDALVKGSVVAVNVTTNKAPIAVGIAALSSMEMCLADKRGKCVNVLHIHGDFLWSFGSKSAVPELGPVIQPGVCFPDNESDKVDLACSISMFNDEIKTENIEERKTENDEYFYADKSKDQTIAELEPLCDEISGLALTSEEGERMNKTESQLKVIDELVVYCFLKALKTTAKKIDPPLLTSNFYKLHMIPACPPGMSIDIKKSSYKKLSNFLSEMEKIGIINLDIMSKGVQCISAVKSEHSMLEEFIDVHKNLRTKAEEDATATVTIRNITEMYTVTAAVLPLFSRFIYKKGEPVTVDKIRKVITDYVKSENLQDPCNTWMVHLDPLLNIIIKPQLGTLTMNWETLISSIIEKMGHSYQVKKGEETTVVKGKLKPIDIQVGFRSGNKKVTIVNNLELYGINMQEFSRECQHGVAASTTINNLPNMKSPQLQIQGNQVAFVGKLLAEKYCVPKRYIRGLENAPKKKK